MSNLNYRIIVLEEFNVIRFTDDIHMRSEIKFIQNVVLKILERNSKHIAISFTKKSLLNSTVIGTLVFCAKLADDKKRKFIIILPNLKESYLLEVLNTTCLINTCSSEKELETFTSS